MDSDKEESLINDESSGDSLNCFSVKFDPLKALYSNEASVPATECRTYDNLACFEAALRKSGLKLENKFQGVPELAPRTKTNADRGEGCSSSSTTRQNKDDIIPSRNFLPHQMAIKTSGGMKPKHSRNLLLKMQEYQGPLATLQKYREERKKVKIYTRKEKGIRGYTIGFIIAFDIHWNLLLDDAYEIWKRRKYKFSENNAILGDPVKQSKRFDDLGISIPEIEIKSLNRKYVECKRKVNQIFIRGEQIVLIHSIEDNQN